MALTDEAIEKIKQMIVTGELRPGDRLPPEMALSERLGLSRSSLREAVKALEVVRVLDVRRGDGTYVTSLEPSLLLEATSFIIDIHDSMALLDVFEVRRILEPSAVALAAPRITDAEIVELRRQLSEVGSDTPIDELVQHDLEFHHTIATSAGNAYLTSILDGLSNSTVRARVWRGITERGSVERTLAEHERIVAALEARDIELARALTLTHISGVERWLRESVAAATHDGEDTASDSSDIGVETVA